MRQQILQIQGKYPDFDQISQTFPDLENIATQEGLDVFVLNLPVFSCLCYFRNRPFILLNDRLNNIQRTFSLAHELGHYFLHKDYDLCYFSARPSIVERIENEANTFALLAIFPTPLVDRFYEEGKLCCHSLIKYYRSTYPDSSIPSNREHKVYQLMRLRIATYFGWERNGALRRELPSSLASSCLCQQFGEPTRFPDCIRRDQKTYSGCRCKLAINSR